MMKWFNINKDKYTRLEYIVYAVVIAIIFITPFVIQLYEYVSDANVPHYMWSRPVHSVVRMLPFLALFILNDVILLPLLFLRGYKSLYFSVVPIILILVWCFSGTPNFEADHHRPPLDMLESLSSPSSSPRNVDDGMFPPDSPMSYREDRHHKEMLHDGNRPKPLNIFAIMNEFTVLCILLSNIALKLYMQTLRNAERMELVRMEQITSELKSLKYQVNPHFLMNTLNNIQALIDIDSSRAQNVIQKLSNMMRYMLYESDKPMVPLIREIEFMQHFIDLMKIRYPEFVRISATFPKVTKNYKIPSLLFISFIENAFKYGVSYDAESIVSISMKVDSSELHFYCMNTINVPSSELNKGGIGIQNVRKRLDLIYPNAYSLKINNIDNRYVVSLSIPCNVEA